MKKLMILGAGEPQARLTRAANDLGYETIVCSIDGDYPGFQAASVVKKVDIVDKERILQTAKEEHIDGIASCCFDVPIETLGYVNDALHLCGISQQAAKMAANKLLMKNAFEKHHVNTARYRKISSESELKEALCVLTLPVIIKAVDLAGSVGIYKAESEAAAYHGFHEAMKLTKQDYCIVEEFIVGEEFGAQAFVYQGDVKFVIIHGDTTYMTNANVPVGHYVPYGLTPELEEEAKRLVVSAIKAIGLDNCAVNVDLIIRNNQVYMIELTGRCGATCLAELVSIYLGVNYYKAIALMAAGDDPMSELSKSDKKYTANASLLLLSEKSGIVKEIKNNNQEDASVYEFTMDVKPGDMVKKFESSKDKIGQLIVKGQTYEECAKKIEEYTKKLDIVIE